jgi:hypothetical protein
MVNKLASVCATLDESPIIRFAQYTDAEVTHCVRACSSLFVTCVIAQAWSAADSRAAG